MADMLIRSQNPYAYAHAYCTEDYLAALKGPSRELDLVVATCGAHEQPRAVDLYDPADKATDYKVASGATVVSSLALIATVILAFACWPAAIFTGLIALVSGLASGYFWNDGARHARGTNLRQEEARPDDTKRMVTGPVAALRPPQANGVRV